MNSSMRRRLQRAPTRLVLLLVLALAGCDTLDVPGGREPAASGDASPSDDTSGPSSVTDDDVDAREVSAFAGIPVPDGARDVSARRFEGDIEESYLLLFTVPDGDPEEICRAAGLAARPRSQPIEAEEQSSFGLPDDVDAAEVRQCTGMLASEGVSRRIVLVPRDGEVGVHALAFRMPR